MEGHSRKLETGYRLRGNRTLWFIVLFILTPTAYAAPNIQVLLSSDKEYYRETAKSIAAAFKRQHPSGTLITTIMSNGDWSMANSQLVVAVGSKACNAALEKAHSTALLCTFLPRSTYQELIARHAEKHPANTQRSAIYFDQPLDRYMALIQTLAPKVKNLGTVVGPRSRQLLPTIQALADEHNLTLHPIELLSDESPVAALSAVVEKSDVFLVNPDQASFNKAVANWLLRLSIRQQIPVIAYSRNYVNAGALAAVYSSPENIGRDTGEAVSRWLENPAQPLEAPRYPHYFTVSSNPKVARALGIKPPKNEWLEQQIRQLLTPPDSPLAP